MEPWRGRSSQPHWHLVDGVLIRQDGVSSIERKRSCQKCAKQLAGPGNVLCPPCKERIELACGLSE